LHVFIDIFWIDARDDLEVKLVKGTPQRAFESVASQQNFTAYEPPHVEDYFVLGHSATNGSVNENNVVTVLARCNIDLYI